MDNKRIKDKRQTVEYFIYKVKITMGLDEHMFLIVYN